MKMKSSVQSRHSAARPRARYVLSILMLVGLTASAATRYVWPESPSPAPPYTNWATAAHVIQDAVDAAAPEDSADPSPAKTSQAIPWSQIGANAGADYQGDGLAVTPTTGGARLRCVFQRLEGEATREGLWLTSTVSNAVNDRFRVTAAEVGRVTPCAPFTSPVTDGAHGVTRPTMPLPNHGNVSIAGQTVRFTRPGLVEEYTVSVDGVRQDFVVLEKPAGAGELRVGLGVAGARVEPSAHGAILVLPQSGRRIAYSRLKVTDAMGKELPARMEVGRAGSPLPADDGAHGVTHPTLAVLVKDADAIYPVRIDPTFSDANWISMGGIPGANGGVSAAVVDGSGNLYIGGSFTVVGDVIANYIAKWNGSSWSPLGSGVNGSVFALAVSGSDLYAVGYFTMAGTNATKSIAKWDGSSWSALGPGVGTEYFHSVRALVVSGSDLYVGGGFTTAGGNAATNIAKWDGSSWSALGSGMNHGVYALAVSGSDLYAGGDFTRAGRSPANLIAKWDGSSWSPLGSGISAPLGFPYYGGEVSALAVSGNDLYAGGYFTMAGGSPANHIAKWNGSSWSALGSGISAPSAYYGGRVSALAVSGSDLYAGGGFTTAGGNAATNIAKWNGSSWSPLGSGVSGGVFALVVSGSDVYAGGMFTTAGGSGAGGIAKWDGSSWSALGSGMNSYVYALAVSGNDLYAGGYFTMAGTNAASKIAKWDGSSWSPLGSGISAPADYPYYGGRVSALAVSGSDLYAGGYFWTAGGIAATNIAKWDGSSWSPLGSGMNNGVLALAVSGTDL